MRAIALWLAASSMVVAGVVVARTIGSPVVVAVLGCVLWLAAASAIVCALACVGRFGPAALALMLLAVARGLTASPPWPVDAVETLVRGPAARIRSFVVEGASWPGGRCGALARHEGHGPVVWLDLPPTACPAAEGDRLAVASRGLASARGPRWPGGLDPRELARSRGAAFALSAEHAWRLDDGAAPYWTAVAELRAALWRRARGDDARGLVISSLYGVRTALASERRRELATAGLGHLVAVSGMQVSLVAWAIHRSLLRATAWWSPSVGLGFACSLVGVTAYVGLVGAEAPAIRAAAMTAAIGCSALLGRPAHAMTLLCAASFVMLMVRPAWITDVGFQLSFAAMAAILTMPAHAGIALQSWRVSWSVLPIVVWHFGDTGAWAVVANVIAVPIFALWVTPLGVVAILLEPWLGADGWAPASWGAAAILDVARFIAALPQAKPSALAWVATAALLLGAWPWLAARMWWQRWRPGKIASLAVIAAAVGRPAPPTPPPASFFVFGPRTQPTILSRVDTADACAWAVAGPPDRWPGLLDALAIDRLTIVEHRGRERAPPHVAAVRDALGRDDRLAHAVECVRPSDAEIAAAIAACGRWGPQPFAAVDHGEVRCHVDGDWRGPVVLHSDAASRR